MERGRVLSAGGNVPTQTTPLLSVADVDDDHHDHYHTDVFARAVTPTRIRSKSMSLESESDRTTLAIGLQQLHQHHHHHQQQQSASETPLEKSKLAASLWSKVRSGMLSSRIQSSPEKQPSPKNGFLAFSAFSVHPRELTQTRRLSDAREAKGRERVRQDANSFLGSISLTGLNIVEQRNPEQIPISTSPQVAPESAWSFHQMPVEGPDSCEMLNNARISLVSPFGVSVSTFSIIGYRNSIHRQQQRRTQTVNKRELDTSLDIRDMRAAQGIDSKTAMSCADLLDSSANRYPKVLLDDPKTDRGQHRVVLRFQRSYTVSVGKYVKPAEMKKSLNEKFSELHPDIKITLSKLRSLKRELTTMALKYCCLELASVALAHFYFDQIVKDGVVTKLNRKLCAAACMVLGAKFTEGNDVMVEKLQSFYRVVNAKWQLTQVDILAHEFPIYKQLNFDLHVNDDLAMMYMDHALIDPRGVQSS